MPGEFPYDGFLSHSAKDKPVVRDVATWLKILRFCLIVIVGGFTALIEARSEETSRPSDKLLNAIPDIESRLQSKDVTERAKVLSLLAEAPQSRKEPAKLRYELFPSDYGYVLNKCIEALSSELSERDAEALFASAPLWVDFIQRYKLEGTTKGIAPFLDSKNMYVQFFALQILGGLDARQYEAEVAKLLSAGQKELKRPARELLLQWNSKKLTPLLIQELAEGNEFQRFQAIEALERIGDRSALPALLSRGSDPHENNRRAALTAARVLVPVSERTKLLVPLAREIAQKSNLRHVVDNALAVSIDTGDAEAVPAVMTRLTSKEEGVRMSMEMELEKMSLTVLAREVSAALVAKEKYGDTATNEHVRAGLIDVLKRIGTPDVIPALRVAAADSDFFIQSAAISAVGQLGAKEAVEDLVRALSGRTARDAAIALVRLRDRGALSELKLYLQRAGAVDSNFVYHFNEAYSPDLDKKLKTTRLERTIEALPDELITTLAKEYGVLVKVRVDPQEWTAVAKRTGKVAVYAKEDVDNSIGRALFYINKTERAPYCRVLRAGEMHIIRLSEAAQFITEMLEADFR